MQEQEITRSGPAQSEPLVICQPHTGKPITGFRIIAILISMLIASYIGWRSNNWAMHAGFFSDQVVFHAVAYHMQNGRVLYKDVFDNKPPVIYFLHYFATYGQDIDTAHNTLRYMNKAFSAVAGALFFLAIMGFTRRIIISLISSVLFVCMLYNPKWLRPGGFTEEYAACFIVCAVCFATPFMLRKFPRGSPFFLTFFFAIASLTKEPALFLAVPWMAYVLILAKRNGRLLPYLTFVCAGGVTALAPFISYFLYHGALAYWIDSISFNLAYARNWKGGTVGAGSSPIDKLRVLVGVFTYSWVLFFPFVLSLVSIFFKEYRRSRHYLPIVIILSVVTGAYASVGIGKSIVSYHYLVFLIVAYCFAVAIGIDFGFTRLSAGTLNRLQQIIAKWFNPVRNHIFAYPIAIFAIPLGIVGCLLLTSTMQPVILSGLQNELALYGETSARLAMPERHRLIDVTTDQYIDRAIIAKEGLVVQWPWGHLYAATGGLSPMRYIYNVGRMDTYLQTEEQRFNEDRKMLKDNPPGLIVLNKKASLGKEHPVIDHRNSFMKENYIYAGEIDSKRPIPGLVFIRKDLDPYIKKLTK